MTYEITPQHVAAAHRRDQGRHALAATDPATARALNWIDLEFAQERLDWVEQAYHDRTLKLAQGMVAPRLNVQDLSVVLELAQERLDSLCLDDAHPDATALVRVREAASEAWLAQ